MSDITIKDESERTAVIVCGQRAYTVPADVAAALAELRKDAERYRWLREEWANRKWKHVPIGNNHESDDITSEMEIDAAIDAAIKMLEVAATKLREAEAKLAKVEQICDESIEMARLMGASEHMRVAATIKDRIRALSPASGAVAGWSDKPLGIGKNFTAEQHAEMQRQTDELLGKASDEGGGG